jgi:glycosyltransferase involved in cell wall biosynthesis
MQSPLALLPAADAGMPIVVHSHLRWDFVWQRPQQVLSRLARQHRVLFVEEPLYLDDASGPRLDLTQPMPGVYRAVPLMPGGLRECYDACIAAVRDLLQAEMAAGGGLSQLFERPIQWFYTPMPAPAMIGAFNERAILYDCMDELSKFRFAPAALVDRERLLLSNADVVFAGGHRLFLSKSEHHDNVHFFGCGVDVAHFGRARSADVAVPRDIASLGNRVMGYYGVIDERIDYTLLLRLASAYPDDSLVMIGPVVKVDPRELPQAPNIHWLGQRAYDELPAYVKRFDVCLMPFALNEATEYINPTKTLEYMAAAKPIVSTALSDVKHHFSPIVAVAESHDQFIRLVRAALSAPDRQLIARGVREAQNNTWDSVVNRMRHVMLDGVRIRAARTTRPARSFRDRSVAARGLWETPPVRSRLIAADDGSGA